MKKFNKQLLTLFCLLFLLILPYLVFAGNSALENLSDVGGVGGYTTEGVDEFTVTEIAGMAVATMLGLLGVIFIVLIIYGGILWMTAQGNDQQVEKAQKIIKNSVIGLIITVSSYSIYIFIFIRFIN